LTAASEELLSHRVFDLFLSASASASSNSQSADSLQRPSLLPSSLSTDAAQCLINLFHTSTTAADTAWRAGFLTALGSHIALLSAQHAAQEARMIWALRVLTAFLVSSGDACEDAKAGALGSCGGPVLLIVLQGVRSSCEKDDALCLEVLDMLSKCIQSEELIVERGSTWESMPAFLLRHEFVQWMMRFSQRRKISSVVFCKIMDVMCLCSRVLSGRPALLRYLSELVEMVKVYGRAPSRSSQTALVADEWRCRRFAIILRFIASLHLCTRSTTLLVSVAPTTRTAALVPTEHCSSQGGGLGMDFWLDLIDADCNTPVTIRISALQVLLAVITGSSPHAKVYFTGSNRAIPILVKLLQSSNKHVVLLTLNILWVLAHNNQKAVQMLRRLSTMDIIAMLVTQSQDMPEHASYVELMVKQLTRMLR